LAEKEYENWVNERRRDDWDSLTYLVRESVVEDLAGRFEPSFADEIVKLMDKDEDWWKEYEGVWGAEVRSYLSLNYKQDELPKGNWEYYWVSAVEKASERVVENADN